jgi:hypothetical protein
MGLLYLGVNAGREETLIIWQPDISESNNEGYLKDGRGVNSGGCWVPEIMLF